MKLNVRSILIIGLVICGILYITYKPTNHIETMENNECPKSHPYPLLEEDYECEGKIDKLDMSKCKPVKNSLQAFPYVCTNKKKEEIHLGYNKANNSTKITHTHEKPEDLGTNFEQLAEEHLCKTQNPTKVDTEDDIYNTFNISLYSKIPSCEKEEGFSTIEGFDIKKIQCSNLNCYNKYNQWYEKDGKTYGVPLCGSKPYKGGKLEKLLKKIKVPPIVTKDSYVSDSVSAAAAGRAGAAAGTSVCYPYEKTSGKKAIDEEILVSASKDMKTPSNSLLTRSLLTNKDLKECNLSFMCWLKQKL